MNASNNSYKSFLNENLNDTSDSDDDEYFANEESDHLEDDSEHVTLTSNESDTENEEVVTPKQALVKINGSKNDISKLSVEKGSICCICLHETSDEENELVECDGCGVWVHEGCYGLNDCESRISSQDSSDLTEPWFCDACLLEIKDPQCDLCPNTFGIHKETETGRFIHMLCALYTPYIAFQDVDKLWPVVMDEIPHTKWGERICMLCDDTLLSRTGICIKCDAGMCKAYFHVTCAQKHGFLVDPLNSIDKHDKHSEPYLAYCSQHNDPDHLNQRKRAYKTMISQQILNKHMDSSDKRLERKFQKVKEIYKEKCRTRTGPFLSKFKVPRPITSCPSALKNLLRKAALLGVEQINTNEIQNKSAKNGSLAFSVDFVTHFFDREKKLVEYKSQISICKKQEENLRAEEEILRKEYKIKIDEIDAEIDKNNNFSEILNMFVNFVENYSNLDLTNIKKNIVKSRINLKKDYFLLKTCSKCDKNINQHLLTECDLCKSNYHIGCLDPPLEMVPIKTKNYGWECVACIEKAFKDPSEQIDVNKPRALRTKIKKEIDSEYITLSASSKTTQKTPNKRTSIDRPPDIEKKRRKNEPEVEQVQCKKCSQKTIKKDSIKCSDCKSTYHGKCTQPQIDVKKYRGYAWICGSCGTMP